MQKEYKSHRKELLFNVEKAKFPETMPEVETYLEIKESIDELRQLRKEIVAIQHKLAPLKERRNELENYKYRLRHQDAPKKRKKFIKKCPVDGCKGFLSSGYKCGVCSTKICAKCMEPKDAEHECDYDTVATIALIKADTKACPSCHTNIHKINGCDQMWCTNCRVAFSWSSGDRINGQIHNPHFYEFLRKGEHTVRNPGDQLCGGLPDWWVMRRKLHDNPKLQIACENIHRTARHVNNMLLTPTREKLMQYRDNVKNRIMFIVGDINEKQFKSRLIRYDKSFAKAQELVHVYELLSVTFTECIRAIYEADFGQQVPVFDNHYVRLKKINTYCHIELKKISKRYNQQVRALDENFKDVTL